MVDLSNIKSFKKLKKENNSTSATPTLRSKDIILYISSSLARLNVQLLHVHISNELPIVLSTS